MDMILHAALFKGYPIPPTFGQGQTFASIRAVRRRPVNDLRKQIIDAMIALGGKGITIAQIKSKIDMGDALTHQMILHHMRAMHEASLVKRNKNGKHPKSGGQAPSVWSLVL